MDFEKLLKIDKRYEQIGTTGLTLKFGSAMYEPATETGRALMSARKAIAQRYVELVEAEEKLRADKTMTDAEKTVRLARLARSRREWAFEKQAKAQASALMKLKEHQDRIHPLFGFQPPEFEQRNNQLRDRIHKMPFAERMTFIRNAIMEKREDVLSAVASAPIELSGVIPLHRTECRETLAELKFPDDVNAIRDITDELRNIETASRNFEDAVENEFLRPAVEFERQKVESEAVLNKEIENE